MTMTMKDFEARIDALPTDALIVSRTYWWTRSTDGGGCNRGTVAQLRLGDGTSSVAPERAPDLRANRVSLDGDDGVTRDVWILTPQEAVEDLAPGWEDRAVERARREGVLPTGAEASRA